MVITYIARVYADLYRKGLKMIKEIPTELKDQVLEIVGGSADSSEGE